jgi:DNA-binding NarL/FixJ family response regulator
MRRGNEESVRQELSARPVVLATSGVDNNNLGAIAVAAELAGDLEDAELGASMLALLEPVMARDVCFSTSPPLFLPRVAAIAARASGQYERAGELIDFASRQAAVSAAEPDRGLVALEKGRLLSATDGSPDAIGAAMAEAAEVFQRLDMVGAIAWLIEFGEKADLPAQLRRLTTSQDELSATERDILESFSRGLTTQEIADELLLQPRTVQAQLSRLEARLGIATAGDARMFLGSQVEEEIPVARPREHDEIAELTRREREVLGLVARGLTNQQIADELVISLHTAIRHVANILEKTGAANRTEAARLAG